MILIISQYKREEVGQDLQKKQYNESYYYVIKFTFYRNLKSPLLIRKGFYFIDIKKLIKHDRKITKYSII